MGQKKSCQEMRAELGVTMAWEAQVEEKLQAHGPSRRLHSGQPDHCQAGVGSRPGKGGFILTQMDGNRSTRLDLGQQDALPMN